MSRPAITIGTRVRFLGPRLSGHLTGTVERPDGEGCWVVQLDHAIFDADYNRSLNALRVSENAMMVLSDRDSERNESWG